MSTAEFLLDFDPAISQSALDRWTDHLSTCDATVTMYRMLGATVLVARGLEDVPVPRSGLVVPLRTVRAVGQWRLGDRELLPNGTVVDAGGVRIGDGTIVVFAGPCAVESYEQLRATARAVAEHGATGLRGGAFKPRTSPPSCRGRGWSAVGRLADVRAEFGLPVVTEVVEPAHVARVAEVADVLRIGARNAQDFSLLSQAGRIGKPVVLKRGFGTTIDEFSAAAEYQLVEGND